MISKIITIVYLISLLSALWMIYRYPLRLNNEYELVLNKLVTIICSGYFLTISFIYTGQHFEKPILFFSLFSFCPMLWLVLMILKKYHYAGELNLLLLSLLLTSCGLVILYRLDINSSWFLTRALHYEEPIPVAFKQFFYFTIALFGVVVGLIKGYFKRLLQNIEGRNDSLIWGIFAFLMLALPKLFGFSAVLTQDKSLQPSEFVFKVIFLICVAQYFHSRASELVVKRYPLKEVIKILSFIFIMIGLFFFFPLFYLQKELGTALLMALTFIFVITYVTGRISFLFCGLILIALSIGAGAYVSPHVGKRVIGSWLEWKEFAFKPYQEGQKIFPGYQAFNALCSIRLSPWGVGIGNGILKYTTMDKTIVPKAIHDYIAIPLVSELGVIGLIFIGLAYLILFHKSLSGRKLLTTSHILAAGLSLAVVVQGFYSLSSVFLLLPATGIPLPWIAYGGSAMFSNFFLIGLLSAIVNKSDEN